MLQRPFLQLETLAAFPHVLLRNISSKDSMCMFVSVTGADRDVLKRKAGAGTTDDGEKICAFYAREQRADGGCSFMDANGFCNFVHMDEFGRLDKENARRRGGAEAKVARKRPSKGSGGGTGDKKQRNECRRGPRPQAGLTRPGEGVRLAEEEEEGEARTRIGGSGWETGLEAAVAPGSVQAGE